VPPRSLDREYRAGYARRGWARLEDTVELTQIKADDAGELVTDIDHQLSRIGRG
jgi:hypothetical protein